MTGLLGNTQQAPAQQPMAQPQAQGGMLQQGQQAAPQQQAPQQQAPQQQAPRTNMRMQKIRAKRPPQPQGQQPSQVGQGSQRLRKKADRQTSRDYRANPLGLEDKDQFDKFSVMSAKLVFGEGTKDKILARIKGKQHPLKDIASAAQTVTDRITSQAKQDKSPFDPAVLTMGTMQVVKDVTDLAQAAGKTRKLTSKEKKIVLGMVMQSSYQQKLKSGEMTKQSATEQAYSNSARVAQENGLDMDRMGKRLNATEQMQKSGTSAGKGIIKPIQQASNPLSPQATMKDVLAGGLLNG